jgi:hypothetical protein
VKAKGKHPVVGTLGQRRRHVLAPSAADGRATKQREGHIAAELRRQSSHLVGADVEIPEDRACQQCGRTIGRAAGQPTGHWNGFLDRQTRAEGIVRRMGTRQQLGGAYREVGVIERYQIGTFAADHNIELIRIGPCRV